MKKLEFFPLFYPNTPRVLPMNGLAGQYPAVSRSASSKKHNASEKFLALLIYSLPWVAVWLAEASGVENKSSQIQNRGTVGL